MPLIHWKPLQELEELFEATPFVHAWDLAADVYEQNNNVIAEMHIPGIDPDKIEIEVEENHLHVSGSRQEEEESKNKRYFHKEIRRGSFERVISLPCAVDANKTTASFEDGILKIVLPKTDHEEKAKKIKVVKQ